MGWRLKYYNASGVASSWYPIEAPTNDIVITQVSTRKKQDLYTGGKARVIPNTKFNYEEVDLEWTYISGSSALILDGANGAGQLSLKSIVSGGFRVNISTHTLLTVSQVWSGYFVDAPKTYKVGMYPRGNTYKTFYDLTATFDLISIT